MICAVLIAPAKLFLRYLSRQHNYSNYSNFCQFHYILISFLTKDFRNLYGASLPKFLRYFSSKRLLRRTPDSLDIDYSLEAVAEAPIPRRDPIIGLNDGEKCVLWLK